MDPSENSEVEIPSYFVCPISMQLMRDPVTVCTGITYDRESIEKWIYTLGNNTCPATMQLLSNTDFTPNHTLRRLIQQWCVANPSVGVQRISTPRAPLDTNQLNKLLREINSAPAPAFQVKALKKLRSIARQSETNRRCIASSEAPAALMSVIQSIYAETDEDGCYYDVLVACEEAIGVLYCLPLPDETIDTIATGKCLASLASILKRGTSNARLHSTMLLQIVSKKALDRFVMNANEELIEGLVELLTDEVSHHSTMAALEVLTAMTCNSTRIRVKAIEAGAIPVLIESLPEQTSERRSTCERMLCLLDVLCGCAEGRAAIADHAMGIPAVSKKIFRVSQLATEKAVRILWLLCRYSPSERVRSEMLEVGAVAKLCMLMQTECTVKTKSKAKEIVLVHVKSWGNSVCVPSVINCPQSP